MIVYVVFIVYQGMMMVVRRRMIDTDFKYVSVLLLVRIRINWRQI